ncbi:MAG: pilus (MSHA type) biogenesis protein MshL [Geobacteraceae bacterium]|nr:pilus (MSHA type) biogenesis protein MshL [Geobacteraceae bacterium]
MINYSALNTPRPTFASAPVRQALLFVAAGAILLLCGACSSATPPAAKPSATRTSITQALGPNATAAHETPQTNVQIPEEVNRALLPPLNPRSETTPQTFDVAADGVNARAFFAGLAAETRTNVVVHPDISGSISLNLRDVTLEETLNIVREVYGYYHMPISGGYQILPHRIQTRIFEVDYLTLKRSGSSSTRVSSGQVSDGADSNGYSDNDNASTGSSNRSSISGSRINTESESDFWPELRQTLTALVGEKEGRNVILQPHAGLVVVRAMPDELDLVAQYLDRTQGSLQRQVILEAKIIEVELGDKFQSGINWGALVHNGDNTGTFGQIGGGSVFKDGVSSISGNLSNLNPATPTPMDGLVSSAFGGVFSAALRFDDFQAFIEAAETQGDVHVLSSPRVSTINNQKAVIKVGNDEFFVTDVSSDTVTGTTTTTTPDITLTPFFSGIALDVTPQISADGQITLHIHPTVSEVKDQTKIITVSGQEQSLPLAFSSVRESDTIVRAESGQVVVIGGLMKEETRNEKAGVPWLGRIPGVGALFRQQRDSDTKSELVILLRPQVVQNSADWNRAMEASSTRIQRMNTRN